MTPAALGQSIAAALGIAASPVAIATVILLLLSTRARGASLGFLLGWSAGIAAAVTVFTLVPSVVPIAPPGRPLSVLGIAELVVGVILLILAAVVLRRGRHGEDGGMGRHGWLRAIDRSTFPVTFAVGVAMAVNPPNLLLSLAGGIAISSAGPTLTEAVLAVAAYTVVAASTVLVPVVAYSVAEDRLRRPLGALRGWLTRHDAAIVATVLVVLGLLLVGAGAAAVRTG